MIRRIFRDFKNPPYGCAVAMFLVAMGLSSCSTVKVRTDKGVVTREGIASAEELKKSPLVDASHGQLKTVGKLCSSLLREARRKENFGRREEATASYLKAAVFAREQIEAGNFGPTAATRSDLINLHNRALARFAELWADDPRRFEDAPCYFSWGSETYEIVLGADSDFSESFFDRAIASDSIKGEGVVDTNRPGFGASLVGIRENLPGREDEFEYVPEKGLHLPVTLTVSDIRSEGSGDAQRKVVSISQLDPMKRETVLIGNQRLPLAADFSAPMELLLKGRNEVLWGLSGFLNAKKRAEISGLYLMEPYDPDRIPVILVHGLISVPIIWRDLIPEFMSEPEISKRYQFMVLTYPSSYPVGESSLLFRKELREMREKYDPDGNDPLSTNMVVMGHSMGGILTHLLVADIGDHFWNQISDIPIDQLDVSEERREIIRNLTYFESDPAVDRAVFIATPHGGAKMATLSISNSVSRLAKLPVGILQSTATLAKGPPIPGLKVDISKKITSVQSLNPESPVVLGLKEAPYRDGVVYHSIIGDRGKGDTPDSSDGVVDYWSSHQDGAASELIVPADHRAYRDPGAIAEMKRILRLHAGLR